MNRHRFVIDKGFRFLTFMATWVGFLLLLALIWKVLEGALPAIKQFGWRFFISSDWNPPRELFGGAPQIYGTLISSAIAILFAAPLGVGVAIFLNENFLPQKIQKVIQFLVEMLAAVPSVIFGLWGIFAIIPLTNLMGATLHRTFPEIPFFNQSSAGPGMMPASLVLAIMILPTIAALARVSLSQVSPLLKSGALALGATRWEVILHVTIPSAGAEIIGAIALALGRALGETMALAMLIGNSNQISSSLFSPASTIASSVANNFGDASGMQMAALMYLSLILLGISFLVNIIASAFFGKAYEPA